MNSFFKRYTEAFDSLDANVIANLYTLPCSASDGDGINVFSDRASLVSKFTKDCVSMKSMGYTHSHFNILDEIDMGDSKTAINVGWRVFTSNEEIEFRCLYVCHKINNHWLVFSANVYEGGFSDAI